MRKRRCMSSMLFRKDGLFQSNHLDQNPAVKMPLGVQSSLLPVAHVVPVPAVGVFVSGVVAVAAGADRLDLAAKPGVQDHGPFFLTLGGAGFRCTMKNAPPPPRNGTKRPDFQYTRPFMSFSFLFASCRSFCLECSFRSSA